MQNAHSVSPVFFSGFCYIPLSGQFVILVYLRSDVSFIDVYFRLCPLCTMDTISHIEDSTEP